MLINEFKKYFCHSLLLLKTLKHYSFIIFFMLILQVCEKFLKVCRRIFKDLPSKPYKLNMLAAHSDPKIEGFYEHVRCNPSHGFWDDIIPLKATFWGNTLFTFWGENSLWALSITCSCCVTARCIWERASSRYRCFISTSVTFPARILQKNKSVCRKECEGVN